MDWQAGWPGYLCGKNKNNNSGEVEGLKKKISDLVPAWPQKIDCEIQQADWNLNF